MQKEAKDMKKNQYVIPHENGGAVKGEGNKRATKVTKTKEEAIRIAKNLAKKNKSELIIQTRGGKITDKESYGNDHFPPRDKKH